MHAAFQNLAQHHPRIATALWFILAVAILPGIIAVAMSVPVEGIPSLSSIIMLYFTRIGTTPPKLFSPIPALTVATIASGASPSMAFVIEAGEGSHHRGSHGPAGAP